MQRDRSRANLAQTMKRLVELREEPRAREVLQQHRLEVLQEKQQDQWQLECNSRKEESRLTPRLGDAVQVSHSLPSLPQNNKKKLFKKAHQIWTLESAQRKQEETKSGKDGCENHYNTPS